MNQQFIADFVLIKSLGYLGCCSSKLLKSKPSKLPPHVLEGLQTRLQERQGFRSYYEIQEWLATQYNIEAAYATVHGIVRYKLKSKLKASRPVSIEADPQVQDTFKKNSPN